MRLIRPKEHQPHGKKEQAAKTQQAQSAEQLIGTHPAKTQKVQGNEASEIQPAFKGELIGQQMMRNAEVDIEVPGLIHANYRFCQQRTSNEIKSETPANKGGEQKAWPFFNESSEAFLLKD
ncbi:MAG: Uncharacterised protein [Flavobacteriia bacterium]|nr:MAG: Uncharacterised protein [Flavobacteriia bacterium]